MKVCDRLCHWVTLTNLSSYPQIRLREVKGRRDRYPETAGVRLGGHFSPVLQ